MEVHHHPDLHHQPKKWKEYFLEFLMIFLAVIVGFIAENIRENISETEKLKQNIESKELKGYSIPLILADCSITASFCPAFENTHVGGCASVLRCCGPMKSFFVLCKICH